MNSIALFLDPHTALKADLSVTKKSFGVLKGSFVTLREGKSSDPIFIAEGIETALSLKEAGLMGTIKASLGLSNIGRLNFEKGEHNPHIVICADHDAPDSPATRSLEKSVHSLQMKGYAVTVIKPSTLHDDFNDVLEKQGAKTVETFVNAYLNAGTKKLSLDSKSLESSYSTKTAIPETSNSSPVERVSRYLEEKLKEIKMFEGTPFAEGAKKELESYMTILRKDESFLKEIKAHNQELGHELQNLLQVQTLHKGERYGFLRT